MFLCKYNLSMLYFNKLCKHKIRSVDRPATKTKLYVYPIKTVIYGVLSEKFH